MDIIGMKLMEKYTPLPMDIIRYLSDFIYIKLTNQTIKDAVHLWCEDKEKALIMYGHISYWNVSRVTDMIGLFGYYYNFNEDISRWNVKNVKSMSYMFFNTQSFNCDISKWNVSNVKNMSFMFFYAKSFNSDLSSWNVSNVTNMDYIFFIHIHLIRIFQIGM